MVTASWLVTMDFPTPPLPDTTPMTCLMLEREFVSMVLGPWAVRSLHPDSPQLLHSCVHSSANDSFFLGFQSPPCGGSATRLTWMIA